MSDAGWDTGYQELERRGWPLWGKILMGCAISFVLLVASCVGFGYWIINSDFIPKKLEGRWATMLAVTDALQTDEGAAELYRANPGLHVACPTEGEFLKAAAQWRPGLAEFPRTPPTFKELDKGDFNMGWQRHVGVPGETNSFEMSYRLSGGKMVRVRWEEDKVAEIEIR